MNTVQSYSPRIVPRMLFGHPVALTYLFLTGMWEVAALAGMRAILVFFLMDQLHFSSERAVEIFGLSTAGSFLMSMVGGWFADRLLGVRRAVIVGALLLAAGHLMLALPALLLPSLFLIAIGSGLFRPAMLGQVWLLYEPDDDRGPRALLLYKLGCNLGGIFGPIACGVLYEVYGWASAVTFCAAGMGLAVLIFVGGHKFLPPATRAHSAVPASNPPQQSTSLLGPGQWLLIGLVALGGSLHWTVANQQGGTLAVWAYESVDRTVRLGATSWQIPAAWLQAINPILLLAFTPVISWLWARASGKSAFELEIRRMTLGSIMLAGSFAILSLSCVVTPDSRVNWMWLAVATAPLTLGEVYIDSMGQAFFCRQAPARYLTLFLSIWLLTSTIGYVAAGWLGHLWDRTHPEQFFALSAALALVSALVIAATRTLASARERVCTAST